MKINRINKNINVNFKQSQIKQKPNFQSQQPESDGGKYVNTIPTQFLNANVPINYRKTCEFILPGTNTKVHMYKLANGQTVVLAPKNGQSQICTYVKCGGMNESEDINGISHYIEHNLFNGSKDIKPKEFFSSINKMGGYTNAYTSSSNTCYYISSHLFDSEDLPNIIKLHSNMVQYPEFEQSQLDKEKGIVNSEITMYDDDNSTILMGKALKQLLQIDANSNDLVCGTVKNINNLTRDDVVNYYNRNYTPDKMITVLTGEFNPDDTIKMIAQNFTKPAVATQAQYQTKINPIESSKRTDYYSSKINTDEFALMFKGPNNNDIKNQLCMVLLMDILTKGKHAKLTQNLEKYNIIPDMSMDRTGSAQGRPFVVMLSGACKSENTENALKEIYSTIHNLQYENINENLEITKKNLLKKTLQEFETGAGINGYLGLALQNYTPDEIVKTPEIIKSITQEDIKSALAKYMDLNKASIAVAHPQNKMNSLSFKGKLVKKGLNLNEFSQTKLPNNIEVYLKNDNNELKSLFLNIFCPIPADVNPMLNCVLTKILSNGQLGQTDNEFSKDLAKNGINYSVYTEDDRIFIKADALKNDINIALNKIVNTLTNPKFTPQDFEKAKKQVEQEILELQKKPEDYINQTMFPQFKSAPTKEDKLKALSELRLEDLMGFMQYINQNAYARFIWNKNEIPYELMRFNKLKSSSNEKIRTYIPLEKDVIKTQIDDNSQAKIIKTYKFMRSNSPKEDLALSAMNIILGSGTNSRLFNDLRETQQLAYSVQSFAEEVGNTWLVTLKIGTNTDSQKDPSASSDNITKSLVGFQKHIEKIKNEPVSKEELDAAKLEIKANILNTIEDNTGKMFSLLKGLEDYADPNNINYILNTVDELTPQDIQKIAQKAFAGNSLTSIVANEKTLKELNLVQQ